MTDYATRLGAAHRHLQDLSDMPFTTPRAESPAPQWLTSAEGQQYLAALQHGADDEALDIYDQAYAQALDEWINALWASPWPANKKEGL